MLLITLLHTNLLWIIKCIYETAEESINPLGIESGYIGASQMSGVFRWSAEVPGRYYSPDAGRLNFASDGSMDPQLPGCSVNNTDRKQWLQVSVLPAVSAEVGKSYKDIHFSRAAHLPAVLMQTHPVRIRNWLIYFLTVIFNKYFISIKFNVCGAF